MIGDIRDLQAPKGKVIFFPDGYGDRVRSHDRDLPCRNAVFTPGGPVTARGSRAHRLHSLLWLGASRVNNVCGPV